MNFDCSKNKITVNMYWVIPLTQIVKRPINTFISHFDFFNCRDKLSAVKSDVETVEKETEANMHTLVLMDR